MRRIKRAALWAGLLLLSAVMGTGCAPRGGVVNPGWTVVTASDGVVYSALSSGQVLALDAERGSVLWQYPLVTSSGGGGVGCSGIFPSGDSGSSESPLDAVYGLPVTAEGLVLVAALDGGLYGFDQESGERVLEFNENPEDGAVIGGVTVYDGAAYYGSGQSLLGVNIQERSTVWSRPFVTEGRIWGAPAVDAEYVYVGSMDHYVYAVDRTSGEQVWRYDIGASIPGAVTLADGRLFVGAIDSRLHVLDAATGDLLWQTDELDGWVWGEALVIDDVVFFGSLDGQVYALNASDGSQHWSPAQVAGALRAGPANLDNTYLVVGTDSGAVYTVNVADGVVRERFKAPAGVLSTPTTQGNMIYLGTANGSVIALDLESPIDPQVWIYPPAKK